MDNEYLPTRVLPDAYEYEMEPGDDWFDPIPLDPDTTMDVVMFMQLLAD